MKRKSGFTLIELLVVIAIIAVLMGILMPALRAVRDQAKRTHCVTNCRTLSMGWLMYAEDNDNKLVDGHTNTGTSWVDRADASMTIEQKMQTIRDGLLYKYVGKEINVYRCPADYRLQDAAFNTFRSFSIAGGANGESNMNTTIKAKSLLDIKRPGEKYIFVEDIDPRGYNVGSWIMSFNPIGWIDPLAMWHNERSTIGFADGHAEMHQWQDKSFIEWGKKAMYSTESWPGFGMNHPADETADVRYMAKGYPHKKYTGQLY
jgi:prepilin-type N-terminal cleavage/methylation domain-containing protein/prepilin-type processing-associated H-X9-DG protein